MNRTMFPTEGGPFYCVNPVSGVHRYCLDVLPLTSALHVKWDIFAHYLYLVFVLKIEPA